MKRSQAEYQNAESPGSCLSRILMTMLLVAGAMVVLVAATSTRTPARATEGCAVSAAFPDEILQWCDLITEHAATNGLDPDLVAALIWQESGGNRLAYSRSGAVGLMQVMPRDGKASDFMCPKGPCFQDRPTMVELRDADFNIEYGTRYLKKLTDKHRGNLREALREYGPIDVEYHYADTVLALYHRYRVR